MDVVRFGRGVRALRRRRGWRQVDLATAAGLAQSVISRIERGGADRLTVRTLDRITAALGARVNVRLDFNGEALDRLLDAAHAVLVERAIARLRALGWECATEVSFAVDGERGSVDIVARHAPTGARLIVEVKSVVPDLQGMLMTLDRKARLARPIAHQLGWSASAVGRVLILPDDRTARRRVASHGATFAAALPHRGREIARCCGCPGLRSPCAGSGSWADIPHATPRHRVSAGPSRH